MNTTKTLEKMDRMTDDLLASVRAYARQHGYVEAHVVYDGVFMMKANGHRDFIPTVDVMKE